LQIRLCTLSAGGVAALLATLTALTLLSLADTRITDDEAGALAAALGESTQLRHLDLSKNTSNIAYHYLAGTSDGHKEWQLNDGSAEALAPALAKLAALTALNLRGHAFTAHGRAVLAHHLGALRHLRPHCCKSGAWEQPPQSRLPGPTLPGHKLRGGVLSYVGQNDQRCESRAQAQIRSPSDSE
jgi:hypothetical protein